MTSGQGQWRLLDALAEAVTITQNDGTLVFANAAALEMMGFASLPDALALHAESHLERYEITAEDGRALMPEDLPGRRLARGEPAEPLLLRLRDRDSGRVHWRVVKASELHDEGGRQLALNVIEDVTEAKERERRERFLARVGEILAESMDYEDRLRDVARLAVPELADWCSVEIIEGEEIRQLAVAHADAEMVALGRELRERWPPTLEDRSGVGAVLRDGRTEFHPTLAEELLAVQSEDPARGEAAQRLGLRSAIVAPMRARGRVLGAITLIAAESAGVYDDEDVAFIEDFAIRAAIMVDNARLYRERSETVRMLQRSLVPPSLTAPAGWRVSSLYRPADGPIGGDFFDVLARPTGLVALIGDVTGKGDHAAGLTAMIRHSAAAGAALGFRPDRILALVNRMIFERDRRGLATIAIAQATRRSGHVEVTLACAGHPPPLHLRAGAAPVPVDGHGLLLGLERRGAWRQERFALHPGDALLFYTDGVTDARGAGGRFELERLLAAAAGRRLDPEAIVGRVERALTAFERGPRADDAALVALQLLPREH